MSAHNRVNIKEGDLNVADFRAVFRCSCVTPPHTTYVMFYGGTRDTFGEGSLGGPRIFSAIEEVAAKYGMREVSFTHGDSPYDTEVTGFVTDAIEAEEGNAYDRVARKHCFSLR